MLVSAAFNSKALDLIAISKGFSSWKNVLRKYKSVQNPNDALSSAKEFLPVQAINSINSGHFQTRRSYISLDSIEPKLAKKELIQHLKRIVRNSKKHASIEVFCDAKGALVEKVDPDQFFGGIHDMFLRITDMKVNVVSNNALGRNLFDFEDNKKDDPLHEFLYGERDLMEGFEPNEVQE